MTSCGFTDFHAGHRWSGGICTGNPTGGSVIDEWKRPLPQATRKRDPELLGDELLQIIADDIEIQPRSLQKEIGPSELGSPCARKVAYGLLQIPAVNKQRAPKWRAYVGTAIHGQLERAFDRYNLAHGPEFGYSERFLIETEIKCGEIAGKDLIGHCDVYDRLTCTVIDWKTTGPTNLRQYRINGPSEQYRAQAHLYGRGWAKYEGLQVDHVMLVFLPRNGELSQSVVWYEPYDEAIALRALARADLFMEVIESLGAGPALAKLPAVEDHCGDCDWFAPNLTWGSVNGCPGVPGEVKTPAPAITMTGGPA